MPLHMHESVRLKADTTGVQVVSTFRWTKLLPRLGRRIDLTRRRVPLRAVLLQLEVRAGDEGQLQVLRILDDGADEEDDVAVRLGADLVEVFRDGRGRAVRHAVLAKVAVAEVRRGDKERAATRRRAAATATA